MGFDASRGDSVSVINAPFARCSRKRSRAFPSTSTLVLGCGQAGPRRPLHLVLVFGVLRPVLKNLSGGNTKDAAALAAAGGAGALGAGGLDGCRTIWPTTR